jgi:3-oxoacyl-[acyl-carrier protein] reductase
VRYLVNNAGPASSSALTFGDGIAGTVGSVELVTSAWLATDPPEGAAVVNVASVAGNLVGTDSAWYSAGKAAIAGYTRHLATRIAPRVRANAVAPGFIDTPMSQRNWTDADGAVDEARRQDVLGQRGAQSPLGVTGEPADIAYAMLYLASDASKFMTGQVLRPNGGVYMA